MTTAAPITVERLEVVVHEALARRDFDMVITALNLMGYIDPARTAVVMKTIQLGLDLAASHSMTFDEAKAAVLRASGHREPAE